ncbi:MAG: cbb3-type cytochrome oxidase assembly protein CcoS [Burkholderiales bacterium]|nr:cbb3-type cytochrome oxidase assembly protein CcoS [Burkholderiales bacterium]
MKPADKALGALFWRAVRSGRFDDLKAPAQHILMDDDSPFAAAQSAAAAAAPRARRRVDWSA